MQTIVRAVADEASLPRDLLIELTLRRGRLRHGLQQALRSAIQDGRLPAGTTLPASRRLATDLGVSRGVVADTYDQLAAECYLLIEPRRAPIVAAVPTSRPAVPDEGRRTFRFDFVATTPDVELFPRRAWSRALERAIRWAPNEALDYADHRGRVELRVELAAYLGRVRGVRVTPDRILVTQGFTQALDLVCRVVRDAGAGELWFESPSLAEEWETVAASGLRVRAVPVDREGIRTAELPDRRRATVVVTPAHQFPTGAVLPASRRHALVSWARRYDGLVVEDDYDAEFRYDRAGIGAVQGLDPDRVIHIGTASKTLAPGLRLGWMSVPEAMVGPLRRAKAAADSGSPAVDQLAFAGLLQGGEYDRHVARVRQVYRTRRDRLVAALARRLPGHLVEGAAAGLHVVVRFPGADDLAIARTAAARDVGVRPLSAMYLADPVAPPEAGLVLGYGRLPAERIEDAVAALAAVLRDAGAIAG